MADQIRQRADRPSMACSLDAQRFAITFDNHADLLDAIEWLHGDGMLLSDVKLTIDHHLEYVTLSLQKSDNLLWQRCDFCSPFGEVGYFR